MTYTRRFKNEQETFDWLYENIPTGWFISQENMQIVVIEFYNQDDAIFASQSLGK